MLEVREVLRQWSLGEPLREISRRTGLDRKMVRRYVKAAERAYDQREEKDPELLRGLALVRGKVLADQGDAAGAEQAFRQEIALFPESCKPSPAAAPKSAPPCNPWSPPTPPPPPTPKP